MKALIPLNQTFNGIHLRFKHGILFWYVLFLRFSMYQTVQILLAHTLKHSNEYTQQLASKLFSCFLITRR